MQEKKKALILLTNDDGVFAPGLRKLFIGLAQAGETIIVAPDRDNSAVSHSLSLHRPLMVKELEANIFSINGTPADCVTIGLEKVLSRKPDLIVSGINAGANLGHDISYSGTVSAAKEGTIRGVPSMALSIAGRGGPYHFDTGLQCAGLMAELILTNGLPGDCYLNINIPNVKPSEIRGLKITRQGSRMYENALQELSDPWGRPCLWIGGGKPSQEQECGTDSFETEKNYISITPIHLDLTNYEALDTLQGAWGSTLKGHQFS
ncbi:MAG: 5'/3'-nucleotidase SurE [Proteobacteria bacterium]|nr:5'/3'-nucleotidase SurE [Pseudomonadota bacterium]MBU4294397.1 5'/3'-nucleotidase SurE [Pseudomonadota bacterium]MCG2747579.1 5'/3'-nucleotidase SurE [Desulfobulbaceae bacterium]